MKMVSSILLFSYLSTACGDRSGSTQAGRGGDDSGKPTVVSTSYAKQHRAEYEARIQAILDEYTERGETLSLAARNQGLKIDEAMSSVLGALAANTSAAALALEHLRAAESDSWQDQKAGVHAALDELETSYDRTVSQLEELTRHQQTAQGGVQGSESSTELAAGRQ